MLLMRIFCIHHIIPFLYPGQQLANLVRRCLSVVIQAYYHFSMSIAETSHQCSVLSEVSGQINAADIFPLRTKSADDLESVIRRTVIDQYDLIRIRRQLPHRRIKLRHHFTDRLRRAIAGYYKTDKFAHSLSFLKLVVPSEYGSPASILQCARHIASSVSINLTSRFP